MKTYIEYIKHVHILKLGQINTTPLPTLLPPELYFMQEQQIKDWLKLQCICYELLLMEI